MENKFENFLEAFKKMHEEAAKLKKNGYTFEFNTKVSTTDEFAEEREQLVSKM